MVPQRFTRYATTDNCRENNIKSISRKSNGNYSSSGRDSGKFSDSSSIVSGSGSVVKVEGKVALVKLVAVGVAVSMAVVLTVKLS